MPARYGVGEEIKVEFIGRIEEIKIKDGTIEYRIGGNLIDCMHVTESYMTPLDIPFEKENFTR